MPTNDYINRSDALSLIVGGNELIGRGWLIKELATLPAADVEPVRHGRWIPINRTNPSWSQFGIAQHKCSECGGEEMIARKRCPECGAKMDAELPKGENDALSAGRRWTRRKHE